MAKQETGHDDNGSEKPVKLIVIRQTELNRVRKNYIVMMACGLCGVAGLPIIAAVIHLKLIGVFG